MVLPDGRPCLLDDEILAEPSSEGRVILWVPWEGPRGYRHWDRVGSVAHAAVTTAHGVCSIAATSLPLRQRRGGPIVMFLWGLKRATSDRSVTMPDGTLAETYGIRQTDLRLVWSENDFQRLDETVIKTRWPQSLKLRRIGPNLYVVWGVEAERIPMEPVLHPGESPRSIAERALATARQNHDPSRSLTASVDLGIAYINEGHATHANEILTEALAEARRIGDSAQEADLLSTLALAANTEKQPARARKFLGPALAHARATGDRYAEKLALDRLAVACLGLGDATGASVHIEQARLLAAELNDHKHEADLLWRAAILHADRGQRFSAVQSAQAALALLRQLGNPTADWYAQHLIRYRADGSIPALAVSDVSSPDFGGAIDASILTAPPLPAAPPSTGPGLLRMAVTAVQSMATFVGSGFKTASPEAYRGRLAVCAVCKHHTGVRCRICGCITAAKARLLHERCPAGRWRD